MSSVELVHGARYYSFVFELSASLEVSRRKCQGVSKSSSLETIPRTGNDYLDLGRAVPTMALN